MAQKSARPSIPVAKYYSGDALETMRDTGDLRGWFGYAIRGRKSKQSEVPKVQDSNTKTKSTHHDDGDGAQEGSGGPESRVIDSNTTTGAAPVAIAAPAAGKTSVDRGSYNDWRGKDFDRLRDAVASIAASTNPTTRWWWSPASSS